MDQKYNELVKGRIFIGGAEDTEVVVANEPIDVVVDVRVKGRDEVTPYNYIHAPIADESNKIAESIQTGVKKVVEAYQQGKNVYIHCGSGNGRASVMAVATLMELGHAKTLEDAEHMTKSIRPTANVRTNMKDALTKLYK
ncbi:dual specificity protein phosphatase family protein [Ureibacillus composti]|nr:dual specificity protein phosphatase family protein [Ureibacillus composti]